MGLITSTYRMMYLTAYQLTLESKIQWISTAKMELMASSNDILTLGNDLDPDNPAVKQMEARRDRLTVLEKKLDMQMQEYQTRIQAVQKELESCRNAVNKSIERSFSYQV